VLQSEDVVHHDQFCKFVIILQTTGVEQKASSESQMVVKTMISSYNI